MGSEEEEERLSGATARPWEDEFWDLLKEMLNRCTNAFRRAATHTVNHRALQGESLRGQRLPGPPRSQPSPGSACRGPPSPHGTFPPCTPTQEQTLGSGQGS